MHFAGLPLWKEAPFVRILLPFIIGILNAYYSENPAWISWTLLIISLGALILFSFRNLKQLFINYSFIGMQINLLLAATGGIIADIKNPYTSKAVIEKFASGRSVYYVTISEPLSEKQSSWKVLATLNSIQNKKEKTSLSSGILLYFRKDSLNKNPSYGDRILFIKSPEKIKNTAAMKTFDYVRYCALKNIHYQVFLDHREFILLPGKNTNALMSFIFSIRSRVVKIIRKYIKGKEECGLALAILIGYKDDLDKNLIQSYSNTGVVHVVAISGLHLGLIYGILKFFCIPFKKRKWMAPVIILSGLWIFSLLAGA
jgi:competence protein ComEC